MQANTESHHIGENSGGFRHQPIGNVVRSYNLRGQRKRRRRDGGLQATKPLQLSCYRAAGSGLQLSVRRVEDNYRSYFLALLLVLSPIVDFARETPGVESPAFTTVPELSAGFDLLYEQKFAEAREAFASWESRNPKEPFGEVAVAARREKQNAMAQRLLRELSEQYPDSELFASEYAKAMSVPSGD